MQAIIAVVFGLVLSAPVIAEPLVEGWVRRSSGESVEAAQVRIFDWTNLQRGAVAQATTDAGGHFALPLAALGGSVLPQAWKLGQNYPNPFNPSTLIPYHVPTAASVRLEVFNVLGQRVATLVDEERSAGVHTAAWNATDAVGRPVGAGVYFYRLRSAGQPTLTRRMVLLDGQAGQATASAALPIGPAPAAAEGVYGLAVTGAGLVTYVDASFGVRSGMAPVELIVEGVEGLPRGKALTDGVLGDVNGDGQVTLDDVVLVMTYSSDGSVALPANGDISLGDVNGDGQVTLDDAQLLLVYVENPTDPSLPAGIGQAVTSSDGGLGSPSGSIRRLTDYGGTDRFPSWSPDGQHIAFASNGEIYVMGSDGSNQRRLTNSAWGDWDWSPSWSPDGQHIAFESDGEIYVMGSDGSNQRNLTNNEGRDRFPSWSPDGQHIAFESDRDGNGEIYVMGSDGSNQRNLTNHPADDEDPSWSPDGRHIAFASDGEIYVMGSDGSNQRNLTTDGGWDRSPSWSPDGQHIAFASYHDGNSDIYVMGSDGSNQRRLTDHWAYDGFPSWSPNGQHIAFVSERDGNEEIYVTDLKADSGGVWVAVAIRRLTDHSAWDGDPSWSPDGRHIAFASDRDGREEIYVMGSDGSNQRNLTTDGGSLPSWSPDGQRIAFKSYRDGDWNIYVMRSDGDSQYSLLRFPDGYYSLSPSWSPDGQHIAFSADEIYVMEADGSNYRRLTTDGGKSPSWSPDGRHIAFHSWGGNDHEIYVMEADGSNQHRLTYKGGPDRSPSWSPDGRHIAFTSDRDGREEIYVMEADGSNQHRLTYNSARDWFPSWSPDGHHIAFVSDRDGNEEIYVMELSRMEFGEVGGDSSTETKKDRIVEVLFGLNLGEADAETYHDYNDYMARPNDTGDCDGYRGGHSGWDVQTKSVAGDDKTADEVFYSLTSGQVIAIGGWLGKIAVYNATDDKTTLYLHAREIYVSQGQTVNVGTALGIQGNVGLGSSDPSTDEHVHIEVRDGRSEYAGCGADGTSSPIDYLYEAIQVQ